MTTAKGNDLQRTGPVKISTPTDTIYGTGFQALTRGLKNWTVD
jgi:hypothetical protein